MVIRLKRLICFVLLLLALSPLPAGGAAFESELRNADTFYSEHLNDAKAPADSDIFEIGLRVCKIPEAEQTNPDIRMLQYDLVLSNKTDKPLKNLSFRTHFNENLQIILPAPNWYNEPIDIQGHNDIDSSYIAVYSWTTFVNLLDLGLLGEIQVDDFYDFMIEITWDGGAEIIRFGQDTAFMPEKELAEMKPYEPLDLPEVESMLMRGIEIRIERFGE